MVSKAELKLMRVLLHSFWEYYIVSTLKAFGTIAIVEAISWLALLGGMFFKYVIEASWGESAVRTIGQIHGFFVVIYVVLLAVNHVQHKWPIRKTIIDLVAVAIPGAGFWVGKNAFAEDRLSAASATSRAA